jgi:hypothetical protein
MAGKQVRQTYDLHELGHHTQVGQEGLTRRDLQAILRTGEVSPKQNLKGPGCYNLILLKFAEWPGNQRP